MIQALALLVKGKFIWCRYEKSHQSLTHHLTYSQALDTCY